MMSVITTRQAIQTFLSNSSLTYVNRAWGVQ